MNTRQAANFVGITYRQLDYLIAQGVIQPSLDFGQGKAREFSRRDLALTKVVALLRGDGFRIEELREATTLINKSWLTDNPKDAGTLGVLYNGKSGWNLPRDAALKSFRELGEYFFYTNFDLPAPWGTSPYELLAVHEPGFSYSVRRIAQEVYQELDKIPEP